METVCASGEPCLVREIGHMEKWSPINFTKTEPEANHGTTNVPRNKRNVVTSVVVITVLHQQITILQYILAKKNQKRYSSLQNIFLNSTELNMDYSIQLFGTKKVIKEETT